MRLVVVDGYKRELCDVVAGSTDTRLLVLHCPPQVLIDAARHDGKDLPYELFLPISSLAKSAKDALRAFVPNFYARFPFRRNEQGRSLAEILFPGDPGAWWLTDMSEKSAFRGKLIPRLYSLALLNEALQTHRPQQVWISLTDKRLAATMVQRIRRECDVRIFGARPWATDADATIRRMWGTIRHPCRATMFAWGTLAELILVKTLIPSRTAPDPQTRVGKEIALFSFFPVWWRAAWDESRRREVFYQGLPQSLSAHGFAMQFVVWVRIGLLEMFKRARRVRRLGSSFLCLQSLCGLGEAFRLLLTAPKYSFRALRVRLHADDRIFAGFDVEDLVRDDLLYTVGGRELFRNLLMREAVRKLPELDLFLFRVEFQPFERALLQGLQARRVTTVGYQHSSVGRDYLSHVFAPGQLQANDGNDVATLRVPDHVVTTGVHVSEIMRENGFREGHVHIAGPLRYQALRSRLREERTMRATKDESGKYNLLVPVSLDYGEAMGFAAVLAEALVGAEDRFTLSVKGHPANNHARIFSAYVASKVKSVVVRVMPDDANLYDCISSARALVMTGSTVGLEAIALGTPVIMFTNDHLFSFTASSLNAVEDAVVNVSDVASLKAALMHLYEDATPFPDVRAHWPRAMRAMFYDFEQDPEERFLSIVREILDRKSGVASSATHSTKKTCTH